MNPLLIVGLCLPVVIGCTDPAQPVPTTSSGDRLIAAVDSLNVAIATFHRDGGRIELLQLLHPDAIPPDPTIPPVIVDHSEEAMSPLSRTPNPTRLTPAVGQQMSIDPSTRLVTIPCVHPDGLLGSYLLAVTYHDIKAIAVEIFKQELAWEERAAQERRSGT